MRSPISVHAALMRSLGGMGGGLSFNIKRGDQRLSNLLGAASGGMTMTMPNSTAIARRAKLGAAPGVAWNWGGSARVGHRS